MNTPVTVKIDLSDSAKKLIARLGSREGMGQAIARAMDDENIVTVAKVKQRLSVAAKSKRGKAQAGGDYTYPMMRTRRLRNSIGNTKAVVTSDGHGVVIESAVGSGVGQGTEAVRYAGIHEYGGVINVPSRPTLSTGRYGIKHPTTKAFSISIPMRSYLRTTVREASGRYTQRVSKGLMAFLKEGQN